MTQQFCPPGMGKVLEASVSVEVKTGYLEHTVGPQTMLAELNWMGAGI